MRPWKASQAPRIPSDAYCYGSVGTSYSNGQSEANALFAEFHPGSQKTTQEAFVACLLVYPLYSTTLHIFQPPAPCLIILQVRF